MIFSKGGCISTVAALVLGLLTVPAFGQGTPSSSVVRVVVDGRPPVMLDHAALASMPRSTINTPAIHHEAAASWQGVALEDVSQRAGAPVGDALRGHAMDTVVRVTAIDHYQVLFSLGELDPMLGHEQVLLADTRDGQPLSKDGPFRLVVPGDKRPARWIHSVTSIEVIRRDAP